MRRVEPLPDLDEVAAIGAGDLALVVDPITRRPIGGAVPRAYAEAITASFGRIAAHHEATATATAERHQASLRRESNRRIALDTALLGAGCVGRRLATLATLVNKAAIDEDVDLAAVTDLVVDCLRTMAAQIAAAEDAGAQLGEAGQ